MQYLEQKLWADTQAMYFQGNNGCASATIRFYQESMINQAQPPSTCYDPMYNQIQPSTCCDPMYNQIPSTCYDTVQQPIYYDAGPIQPSTCYDPIQQPVYYDPIQQPQYRDQSVFDAALVLCNMNGR